VEFRILGPLEVARNGAVISIGGGKQRALLAILVLRRNEVVPTDVLIESLWSGSPPATAGKIVQLYVSQLRKALGDDVLVTRSPGYVLGVEPGQVDAERAEQLLAEGRRALADGLPDAAAASLREARDLWRGLPLADFAYEDFAQREIARLEEVRLAALEERIEADLALGRHADLAVELEALVDRNPVRERLRAQLALALYRCGRQAEALAMLREARGFLDRELGLEPSPALQELERRILKHDEALAAPPRVEPPAESRIAVLVPPTLRRRGPALVLVGALLLGAGLAALGFELTGGSGSARLQTSNALGLIEPGTNRLVDSVPLGIAPGPVAAGAGALWVADTSSANLVRVDPKSRRVTATIALPRPADAVAAGGAAVWTVGESRADPFVEASRIDPRFDEVAQSLDVPSPAGGWSRIALTGRGLWVVPAFSLVTRVEPSSGRTIARIDPRSTPTTIAAGDGALWTADDHSGTLTKIDADGVLTTVPVGNGPAAIAVGAGAVWVADSLDGLLVRIDPQSAAVEATIRVGANPVGVAIAAGSVWVANQHDRTVVRVDPRTNRVVARIAVGGSPQGLAADGRRVWVALQTPPPAPATISAGNVLRVDVQDDFGSLDPAVAYNNFSNQILYATCAKLVNYPDAPAPAGSHLEAEVAEALPAVSADGRTYTFTVRKGFRFSPPSNEPVTAQTFKDTIERTLDPRAQSPAQQYARDIVGEQAYAAGKARHISGVVVNGNTLAIHLTQRAPDLPVRLSLSFFCAVPSGTPVDPRGLRAVPSAGPYYVASYSPNQSAVLKRNPNYTAGRPRRFAEIDLTVGVAKPDAVKAIEAGTADYALDGVAPDQASRLAEQYGSGSRLAKAGRQQYFLNPLPGVFYLALNTSRPLFANARMRRAVSYAIDRRALARLGSRASGLPGIPTDQYLPPGMPGYRDLSIYPLSSDLAEARKLAAGRHGTAILYTCEKYPCPQAAAIIKQDLARIGVNVEIKSFSYGVRFAKMSTKGEPFDIGEVGWFADYQDPANFLNLLLDGRQIMPHGGSNFAYFDDPAYNRRLRAAARLSPPERYRVYGALAEDLARNAAPMVAYAVGTSGDFFAARIGCHVFQPIYSFDLAALCLRPSDAGGGG